MKKRTGELCSYSQDFIQSQIDYYKKLSAKNGHYYGSIYTREREIRKQEGTWK